MAHTHTYIYIHFYDSNRRRILIFLVACNPIPNFVLSMNVSILSFISISIFFFSFVRLSFKRVHCTCYTFLFVLAARILSVNACSCALCASSFIYVCARNHAPFLFYFVISFYSNWVHSFSLSLACSLTQSSGSERLFHFYPYCYTHTQIYIIHRIILGSPTHLYK